MANIYVKLNQKYSEQKNAMAKDFFSTLIYPGDKNWVSFKEIYLDRLKNHPDYDLLEIKDQASVDQEKVDYKKEIDDIVTGNWKRAEKNINATTDKQKLKDIKKLAIEKDRKVIVKLVDDRLEELG
jgi:hypothetical protein